MASLRSRPVRLEPSASSPSSRRVGRLAAARREARSKGTPSRRAAAIARPSQSARSASRRSASPGGQAGLAASMSRRSASGSVTARPVSASMAAASAAQSTELGPGGSSTTRRRANPGRRPTSSRATSAPSEWPTSSSTGSSPTVSATSSARSAADSPATVRGLAPWPRRSTARTRNLRPARAGPTRHQVRDEDVTPWTSTARGLWAAARPSRPGRLPSRFGGPGNSGWSGSRASHDRVASGTAPCGGVASGWGFTSGAGDGHLADQEAGTADRAGGEAQVGPDGVDALEDVEQVGGHGRLPDRLGQLAVAEPQAAHPDREVAGDRVGARVDARHVLDQQARPGPGQQPGLVELARLQEQVVGRDPGGALERPPAGVAGRAGVAAVAGRGGGVVQEAGEHAAVDQHGPAGGDALAVERGRPGAGDQAAVVDQAQAGRPDLLAELVGEQAAMLLHLLGR